MAGFDPSTPGSREDFWCKNRLQEYTQRASIPLPAYQSVNEGAQHAPQFRACVWVDGICFTSPFTFPNRKMAEKDVAKYALAGIMHKVKNESSAYISTDTVFCKSIVNEYAKKMNLDTPIYSTTETKVVLPIFVSMLTLNNGYYYGEPGKNKKEAEQFAARTAILSILESESSITMSEIVKSKFRFYDAIKKLKESSKVGGGNIPAVVNPLENAIINNKQVVHASGGTVVTPLENTSINNKQEVYGSGGTVATPLENAPVNNKQEACSGGDVVTPLENAPVNNKQEVCSGGAVATPLENAPVNNKQDVYGGGMVATPLESASVNNKQDVNGSGGTVCAPPSSFVPFASFQFIPRPTVEQNSTAGAGLLPHPEFKGLEPGTSPAAQLAVPGTTLEQHSTAQATNSPRHEFKRPEPETSSTTIATLIEFVPATSENVKTPTTSGKKRRRKGKKKHKDQSPLPITTIPQYATPACSVAQTSPITG